MQAFDQLRDWIEDGTLAPGEILRDHEIAAALGMSRTPVREALQMLESLSAVEAPPGRRPRVATIGEADIARLLPPLAALHAVAATDAASRITPQTLSALEGINATLLWAVNARNALTARSADEQFHHEIVAAAGNVFVERAIAPLTLHWRRYNGLYFTHQALSEASHREHALIIEALRAGDSSEAAETTQRNLLRSLASPSL